MFSGGLYTHNTALLGGRTEASRRQTITQAARPALPCRDCRSQSFPAGRWPVGRPGGPSNGRPHVATSTRRLRAAAARPAATGSCAEGGACTGSCAERAACAARCHVGCIAPSGCSASRQTARRSRSGSAPAQSGRGWWRIGYAGLIHLLAPGFEGRDDTSFCHAQAAALAYALISEMPPRPLLSKGRAKVR